jgi:hypothetical protein
MSQKPQDDQDKSSAAVQVDLAQSSPIVMVLSDPNVGYVSKPDFKGWEKKSISPQSSPMPQER